ncbi:MAG: invasin domain 3-containing protein [Patescibacteria group bacterium]
MAEKIKKGFFKVLPLSVVVFLVIGVSVGVWYSLPVNPAKAAALAPLTTTYLDADADGTVDNIRLTFTNVTACTYEAGDWAVGAAGTINVTAVNGFTNAASCTTDEYIDVAVTTTPDITGGAVDPRLDYTDAGVAGSVVADGNQDAANFTATDAAAPYLVSATYADSDAGGNIDEVTFVFSESTTWTAMTAADWAFSAVGDVNLAGDFLIGDCTASPAVTYTCTDAANAHITSDANKTGKQTTGGSEPTFTYTNAHNDINDTVNNTATFGPRSLVDGAAPLILTRVTKDTNSTSGAAGTADGDLDGVLATFTEVMDASSVAVTDFVITLNDGTAKTEAYADTTDDTTLFFGLSNPTANDTYDLLKLQITGGDGILDYAGVSFVAEGASSAATDGAAPVIVTTSPADNATDVALDANLVITFSEPMTTASVTGAIARVPSFTLGAAGWTAGNTVLTYAAHDAWAGMQNYIITLAGTIASAAVGDPDLGTGPVANPFDFTTVAASSGGSSGGSSLPASVTVTAPNGGETLVGGSAYSITWSAAGVTDTVSIYYSLDSGINFPYTIATGETNDGSYIWTVPNIGTSTAKIKVAAGSLNDISDANFTITYSTTEVSASNSTIVASPTSVVANGTSKSTVTVTVKDTSNNLLSGKTVTLASSRGTSDTVTTVTGTTGANGVATFEVKSGTAGTSTYTATAAGVILSQTVSVVFSAPGETPPVGETPVSLSVGDLIKSSLSSSVYYYGSDGKRHVFPNEKTYKSWYVDFTGIKIIPASQLQGLALGNNVTIRPGTVLVKIQTDPKVYAVEPGGLLRWVPTEARATTLYGSAWATKIVDVPVVFWGDYTFGSDITTDAHPTGAIIQYSGSTDKYYIQGSARRLISTAGFTANHFQLGYVLSVPTTLSYSLGSPLTAEETALTRIF